MTTGANTYVIPISVKSLQVAFIAALANIGQKTLTKHMAFIEMSSTEFRENLWGRSVRESTLHILQRKPTARGEYLSGG